MDEVTELPRGKSVGVITSGAFTTSEEVLEHLLKLKEKETGKDRYTVKIYIPYEEEPSVSAVCSEVTVRPQRKGWTVELKTHRYDEAKAEVVFSGAKLEVFQSPAWYSEIEDCEYDPLCHVKLHSADKRLDLPVSISSSLNLRLRS